MKRARQAEILNIIQAVDVETQEQLLDELKARGFSATQATISRDIKELRLVKELSGGGYRYASSERKGLADSDARLRNIFKEGVTSVDRAQNIVVVRTMPGLASAACSALDSMEIPGMVGSLAGDDTGILIMRDNDAAERFNQEVHKLLK
ncbi:MULTISPECIES: arginine repressor [Pseudoflavonifractor]|uniref:arginine repressor n=1 Tax=Pseudoflavonifractor TaxID=1017280 RepID=UPI000B373977|nr:MULTISPECIES: arginine repressor [Pseudoflavonifractor]MBM6680411.1 arginine repressor [Pseudoflavonifractor capillosus]MBS5547864.1 arginine repressor [Oscillospiraceae bacterium]MBS6348144.1 arginine repressor [Oscillospiraceae bacterium]OUP58916.1 arginine repressor [Pseudoflavonifractor sp. An184]